jgi:hypothetical protein
VTLGGQACLFPFVYRGRRWARQPERPACWLWGRRGFGVPSFSEQGLCPN